MIDDQVRVMTSRASQVLIILLTTSLCLSASLVYFPRLSVVLMAKRSSLRIPCCPAPNWCITCAAVTQCTFMTSISVPPANVTIL